jgi:hypothetical protein
MYKTLKRNYNNSQGTMFVIILLVIVYYMAVLNHSFSFCMGDGLTTHYHKKPVGHGHKATFCTQNYEGHFLLNFSNSVPFFSQFFKSMLIKLKPFITFTLSLTTGPVYHQQWSRRSHDLGH